MDRARYEGDELSGTRMPDGTFLVERGHVLWGGCVLSPGGYVLVLPDQVGWGTWGQRARSDRTWAPQHRSKLAGQYKGGTGCGDV